MSGTEIAGKEALMSHRALAAIAFILFGSATAMAANRQEQVRISVAPDVVLTGVLYLPETRSRAPAAVLYPGSQGSRNLSGLAEHLASKGIVALDLNKRGVAGSGGDWRNETVERQADDLLAAVSYVQSRSEVHGQRAGVIGHSQGGWVAQLAAARNAKVSFVVLIAGPSQTVKEQILTDEGRHLLGWGVPPKEVEGRVEMFGELLDAALSNPAVCGPEPKHYLCGLIGYDPAGALAKIRVPVLALYGERDPMTPPDLNAEKLANALEHLGQERLRTHVFPRANHVFWASETGLRDEYASLDRTYVPGFLDTISSWILQVAR